MDPVDDRFFRYEGSAMERVKGEPVIAVCESGRHMNILGIGSGLAAVLQTIEYKIVPGKRCPSSDGAVFIPNGSSIGGRSTSGPATEAYHRGWDTVWGQN